MSRKVYMILSMLLIAAFALSACGAPAEEPAAPAEAPTAEEPAAEQ